MPPKKIRKVGGEADLAPILPSGTNFTNKVIRDTVQITKYIGNGGFGRIYEGKLVGKGTKVCLKVEKKDSSGLFVEQNYFIRFLKKEMLEKWFKKDFISLPYLICFGVDMESFQDELRYLAMPLYEERLSDVINQRVGFQLKLDEVKKVSLCILNALEYLHNCKVSHRDVKKDNIMLVKKGCLDKVVLIDMGISHWHTRFNDKINPKAKHSGTLLYTSIDAHLGREGVFRSDLEILGYNIIEWLKGSLPWKDYEKKPEKVYEMKFEVVNNPKVEIKKILPSIDTSFIQDLFNLSNSLEYCEVPAYDKIKKSLASWKTTTSKMSTRSGNILSNLNSR